MPRKHRARPFLAAAAMAALSHACGGGAGSHAEDSSPADGDGDEMGASTCMEHALFPARSLREDADWPIGHLQYDSDTGDLYFATSVQLYVLPSGADEPTLVGERPDDVWGEFWLADDRILLPSGSQVPLVDTEIGVLFSMPREGGEPVVQVSVPASDEYGWSYEVGSVAVVGDDVYWVGRDRYNDTTMPLGGETTYYVRTTPWRSPGEPEILHTSTTSLSQLIVGGGLAFVAEGSVQRIIDLEARAVLDETAAERFGGDVVGAAAGSVLVTRALETTAYEDFGTWYVSLDDGTETKLGDVLVLLFIGPPPVTHRDGIWAMTSLGIEDHRNMHVYTFSEADGLRDIGCYDEAGSTFGIEIADDRVVVPTFREGQSTLIDFEM